MLLWAPSVLTIDGEMKMIDDENDEFDLRRALIVKNRSKNYDKKRFVV